MALWVGLKGFHVCQETHEHQTDGQAMSHHKAKVVLHLAPKGGLLGDQQKPSSVSTKKYLREIEMSVAFWFLLCKTMGWNSLMIQKIWNLYIGTNSTVHGMIGPARSSTSFCKQRVGVACWHLVARRVGWTIWKVLDPRGGAIHVEARLVPCEHTIATEVSKEFIPKPGMAK